jgi:hypothetical protein
MIDKFDRQRFERALPTNKATGMPLWQYLGFTAGEHVYAVNVIRTDRQNVRIIIRSSIDYSGYAADTGEDSIRLWLEGEAKDLEWDPLGKAAGRWVTRVIGWEDRLTDKLRELYKVGLKIKKCPICKEWMYAYTSRQQNENNGRMFQTCKVCKRAGRKAPFEWLTDQDPSKVKKFAKAGD